MVRWGQGRFKVWKEEALAICRGNPGGIPMAAILANSRLSDKKKPQTVRHGTQMLKRDSRFTSYYPDKGTYDILGHSHRKVLQWMVLDDEE